jgi:quinol monooxygenase YgiN
MGSAAFMLAGVFGDLTRSGTRAAAVPTATPARSAESAPYAYTKDGLAVLHTLGRAARGRAIAKPSACTILGRASLTLVTERVDPRQRRMEAGAVSELLGIARFKFHEGKVEEYKRLSAQAMEIVRTKDSGTLQFDTYFNDDESECMVIERYRDSAAAIEHWENLRDLSEAILATVSVVHGEVLGEVSAELRANLADGPVQLFTPYQSM